jgi:hypothetical protein
MIERGFKSVEIVQAYILLAYYNAPTERFEDDRTYTYSGIALRMAVELNLWRTPKAVPNMDAESLATFHQERLNRERTWLQVYMLDVSFGASSTSQTLAHFSSTALAGSSDRTAQFIKSNPLRTRREAVGKPGRVSLY